MTKSTNQVQYTLTFDCSNCWLQVGLIAYDASDYNTAQLIAYQQGWECRNTFTRLTSWISEVAKKLPSKDSSDSSLQALSEIVFATHAGSFTGLRLAINTACSLSQLLSIPIYTVHALEFYHRAAFLELEKKKKFILLIHRYSEYFYLCYRQAQMDDQVLNMNEVSLVQLSKDYSAKSHALFMVDSEQTRNLILQHLNVHEIKIMNFPPLLELWRLARTTAPRKWQDCIQSYRHQHCIA